MSGRFAERKSYHRRHGGKREEAFKMDAASRIRDETMSAGPESFDKSGCCCSTGGA